MSFKERIKANWAALTIIGLITIFGVSGILIVNSEIIVIQPSRGIMSTTDKAAMELSLGDFKPELLYEVNFASRDDEPNALSIEIENTGSHHTYVHNSFTITGEYCSEDGQHYGGKDFEPIEYGVGLTKQNPTNTTVIPLPDFLFDDIERKKSFMLKFELEMFPFTPSGGIIDTLGIERKTFIQYDHNEGDYPEWWMATLARSDDMHCDAEPSKWLGVDLNTTKIEHFNLNP